MKPPKKSNKKSASPKAGVPKQFEQFAKKESPKAAKKADKKAAERRKATPKGFEKFAKKESPRPKREPKKSVVPSQGIARNDLDQPIRLNRYIANAGVCSRREADSLIEGGLIKVNGKVVTTMGVKVTPSKDKVEFRGKVLVPAQEYIYLLMNKPKNHITTLSDEKGRRTVMDLVKHYTQERVFPVGRLDRNTTGLLLFTNDGKLTEKLSHPSYEVRKLYHVRLDREVPEEDLEKLKKGIELEDGMVKVDKVGYVEGKGFNEVGVQLHSGKNRVVRRLFESLGYEVEALDRVGLGPLTKKNITRGKCRFLSQKEISFLKMM